MTTFFSLLMLTTVAAQDVTAYFPMEPGTTWIYLDASRGESYETTDAALEPIEVAGTLCAPLTTSFRGKEVGRVYYAIKGGELHIVAFDRRVPLSSSYAVLKDPEVSSRWTHEGETFVQGTPADLKLKGQVSKGKEESFQGKKIETLSVTIEMKVLENFGATIVSTQKAVYGKGIGLLRSETIVKLKNRKETSNRTLIAYSPKGAA